jgi:hypothetical protein
MTDKNYPPFSKGIYEEVEEEVQKIIQTNYENSMSDVELILAHLKCLKEAVSQYIEQIERVLERIESRKPVKKQQEVVSE